MSRQAIVAPYLPAHVRSKDRTERRPVSLHQYLLWMRQAVLEEVPDQLHDADLDGGGTPRLNGDFLAYVDNAFARDEDGSYRFPLRAAMTLISRGPRNGSGNPFMGRFLFAISRGMPWSDVSDRFGLPPDVSEVYALEAMRRLYDAYHDFT